MNWLNRLARIDGDADLLTVTLAEPSVCLIKRLSKQLIFQTQEIARY
jgi:hypothetical protein